MFFYLKAPNSANVGGNVGYLFVAGISPFKNFTSSSNQITAKQYVGGNVGYLQVFSQSSTFEIDFVSCGNTFNSSNTQASIGGILKFYFFLKQKNQNSKKKKGILD